MTPDQFFALFCVCWLTAVVVYPVLKLMRKQRIVFRDWTLIIALPVAVVFFAVLPIARIILAGRPLPEEADPRTREIDDPAINHIPYPGKPDPVSRSMWDE